MKRLTLLLLALVLFTPQGNGQAFAVKLGLNLANFSGDASESQIRPRAHIGFVLDREIREELSVQAGLVFTGKGATFDYGNGDKDAIILSYFEIPINGILQFNTGPGQFQVFGGPYFGFCLEGRYKYLADENNKTEKYNIGTSENDQIKPLDFGLNLGFGYRINDFQIQGNYGGSLTNILNTEDSELRNSIVGLSMAYFFRL